MKVICARALLFFLLLTPVVFVRADVIVDNLNQSTISGYFGPIGDGNNSHNFLIGQEFTVPAGTNLYQLDDVSLLLYPTNGGGNITVSIWNVGLNNVPTNEIAALVQQFVPNAGFIDFVVSSNIMLSPGMYYVVAAPTTPADNGLERWGYATVTNWSGSGALEGYADTYYGGWTNFSIATFPQQMSVIATPVPPAKIALSRQAGFMKLSWTDTNGYVVDSTTNLASPVWQAITNVAKVTGSTNFVTNNWSGPIRFFRLRQTFVVSNLNEANGSPAGGPLGTNNTPAGYLIGQEFTLPSGNYNLNKVMLSLTPVGAGGHIVASIWSPGADNTPGTEVGIISTQLVSTAGNISFVASAPIALSGGSYFVVAAPQAKADNEKVTWNWTSTVAWNGFGILDGCAETYSGGWQGYSISDGPFKLSVETTPAP